MKKNLINLIFVVSIINGYSQEIIENHWDTINFEFSYEYLKIDSSLDNIWQRGQPKKAFFNSAFSFEKAMVTDTINFYPKNNHSFFDLMIGSFNYYWQFPYNFFIGFEHKYDTDYLKDGGYLTISYDMGNTWVNIIDDNTYFVNPARLNSNLYSGTDTLFNGEKGFSGHSNRWISTSFGWLQPSVKKSTGNYVDTVILRFNFMSDSIHNDKEGWMIDNIRLYSVYNSGIDDIKGDSWMKLYPNPANTNINISIKNDIPFTIAIYDVSGRRIIDESNTQNIDISNNPPGIYFIKVVANDRICIKKILIRR